MVDMSGQWMVDLYDEMKKQMLHLQLTNPSKYEEILAKQNDPDQLNNDGSVTSQNTTPPVLTKINDGT